MADLIDRIFLPLGAIRPKIKVHQFVGTLRLYAHGILTRAEIATEFDLQGEESTQAGLVADSIDAEVGIPDKIAQVLRFEAIMFLTESRDDNLYHTEEGAADKTKIQTDAGF